MNTTHMDRAPQCESGQLVLEEPRVQVAIWEDVEAAIQGHHHNPDLQAAKAFSAAMAAHRLTGAPVWPMLVAPPGSMKTHLIGGFDGLPGVHLIDQLTPQTFISGQLEEPGSKRTVPASLLHRIGADGIIIYPDFSTVLAMKHEKKASILADMRRIFDGEIRKEFGTSQSVAERQWKGRITFGVAVTPAIDEHYSIFQTLGERFVMIRWPRAGGVEAALAAMNQEHGTAKEVLKQAIHGLFSSLPIVEPRIPEEYQLKIAALTEIVVRGRTHVPRNGYNKDIIYVPEPESATRLAQQLAQLAKGCALISGRDTVAEEDYVIVRRVGLDCLPPTRRKILACLIAGDSLDTLALPKSSLSYAKEELEAQELMHDGGLSCLATQLIADHQLF